MSGGWTRTEGGERWERVKERGTKLDICTFMNSSSHSALCYNHKRQLVLLEPNLTVGWGWERVGWGWGGSYNYIKAAQKCTSLIEANDSQSKSTRKLSSECSCITRCVCKTGSILVARTHTQTQTQTHTHSHANSIPCKNTPECFLHMVVVVAFTSYERILEFDESLLAPIFFFFLKLEIRSRALISFFRPRSVRSGSANSDDPDREFPDQLCVSSFP